MTPWTVALQAPLSVEFSRQEKLQRDDKENSVHGILQARILEGVAISFSRGSSQHRDQTQVSRITGRFITA